jgi:hypothetical protein
MKQPMNVPVNRDKPRAARGLPAIYGILDVLICIAVAAVLVLSANNVRETKALRQEVAMLDLEIKSLRGAAQNDYIPQDEEGEPTEMRENGRKPLFYTGKVFSAAKYWQWVGRGNAPALPPECARLCSGQPTCLAGGKTLLVRGLNGRRYPCRPEWQQSAFVAADL